MKIENSVHTPVLIKEAIEYLKIEPGAKIIDATISGGGHTKAILEKYSDVKILGIEWDPVIFENLKLKIENLSQNLILVNDSYVNLKNIVDMHGFEPDGILFDLGLSSWHYEESGRGFSFKRNEFLDMRFNPGSQRAEQRPNESEEVLKHSSAYVSSHDGNPETGTESAADIVNKYSQDELSELISSLGEEKFAENIAKNIVRSRREKPIINTEELVMVISQSVPEWYKHRKIHFATKTFQALRIAVNDELGNVRKGIEIAIDVLKPGGRLVAISFHGLEDKIVKDIFKEKSKEGIIRFVVKGTIRPSWEEQKSNPRSRSAKMKVIEKI